MEDRGISLLEKINKENVLRYGPTKGCCNMLEKFCRCYTMDYFINNDFSITYEVSKKLREEHFKNKS